MGQETWAKARHHLEQTQGGLDSGPMSRISKALDCHRRRGGLSDVARPFAYNGDQMDSEEITGAGNGEVAEPAFWVVPLKFATHAIIGLAIFSIIGAAALGLDHLVALAKTTEPDQETIFIMRWMAQCTIGVDGLLYVIFLVKNAYRTAREL
jgi:hypothetical protein